MSEQLKLSTKYLDFLKCAAPVEFLEGTTAAGKTTVAIIKFMLKVAESRKKIHVLSGLDLGTIEKNIINKDLGIVDVFGGLVQYNSSGRGEHSLPHVIFHTPHGDRIIYVLGYDNKNRWKKALGGQYGCLYIDEINIADMEYIREASMRCDYFLATLNPDNPALQVYAEYINHARPLEKYKDDAPLELLKMLDEPIKLNWIWWYFSFEHNAGLSAEKIARIIDNVPAGTKIYKNKILGLRGKASGLVFSNFDRLRHLISSEKAKEENFVLFTAALDTAYSSKSPDTIAMSFEGITKQGKCIVLDEKVYNNTTLNIPIAPSDTAVNFVAFLERNREKWGLARDVFIDSADQATITECAKYKRENGCLYNFNAAWKKTKIVDRILLQLGWFAKEQFLVVDSCINYITELEIYSWKESKDNEPEDANDHMINSVQYGWLPYKDRIGAFKNGH